jgi:hypothetical protein
MPPDATGATDALQFDHAVPAAGGALTPHSDAVPCSACREPVGEEYWDVGGAHACRRCTDAAAREMRPVREWRTVLRAALFGLGAAIAGAAVYYGVIAITEFEIGIVAILIGWMVGKAVRAGARGRGGRRLQVLAVALTYVSVAFAYLPIAMQGAMEDAGPAATSVLDRADTAPASGVATADTTAAAATPAGTSFGGGDLALGAGMLVLLALALPVIVVVGSLPSGLVSALIIGIGMHQAWGMTGAAQVPITGPYRVAPRREADAEPAPAT